MVKPASSRDTRDRHGERRRPRSRSSSPQDVKHRSLVSRAQVPPRPSREAGREEKGSVRAVNRAMLDADRSIVRSRREERDNKRYPSAERDRSRERLPRLSDEDLLRYEFLKRRKEATKDTKVEYLTNIFPLL